jgi:NO-binding membrane sensor protein with MHYT domain
VTSWQLTRVIAGSFVLLSLALGVRGSPIYQSTHWLWLTAFVGVNLLQSGLTRWCLMERILRGLGLRASTE